MDISGIIKKIVPITLFNKGKASQLFSRASKGETLVVVKNNAAVAIILSPEEYEILEKIPKTYVKERNSRSINGSSEIDKLIDKLGTFDSGERYV